MAKVRSFIYDEVYGRKTYGKNLKAWVLEDSFWERQLFLERKGQFLTTTLPKPRYLTRWYVADLLPNPMACCEDMAQLVSNASRLKADDLSLKNRTHGRRICIECDPGIEENVNHIIMQCPANDMIRNKMFDGIVAILLLPNDGGGELLADPSQTLLLLLGKYDVRFEIEHMLQCWALSPLYISKIYRLTVKNRLRLEKAS